MLNMKKINEIENIVINSNEYWAIHSRLVAINAKTLAEMLGLDSRIAYYYGLFHDIGRMYHLDDFSHLYKGFDFLFHNLGFSYARICITHAFPIKNVLSFNGEITNNDMKEFIIKFLNEINYDIYDLLIQLCDSISIDKTITIEKRYDLLKLKNKWNEYTNDKINRLNDIKSYFDKLLGNNIYKILNIK
mgnify:CR=1 FL=1